MYRAGRRMQPPRKVGPVKIWTETAQNGRKGGRGRNGSGRQEKSTDGSRGRMSGDATYSSINATYWSAA